jgi:hypothetical protein
VGGLSRLGCMSCVVRINLCPWSSCTLDDRRDQLNLFSSTATWNIVIQGGARRLFRLAFHEGERVDVQLFIIPIGQVTAYSKYCGPRV